MNFEPSEEQRAMQDMAHSFAADHLAPNAVEWDQTGRFPEDVVRSVGQLGLGGIYVREDVGGSGLGRLDAVLIFEALAHGCPSIGSFISIHNMVAWMVDAFGTEAQRQAWLPKLCAMEAIASYCLTEPGVGSDAAALRGRAERAECGGWKLNGTKAFISGGGFSDVYLAMLRTGGEGAKGISAFLIEKGTPGLSFGANERKMGWKAQPTALVQFDDCTVAPQNLLGEEGCAVVFADIDGDAVMTMAERAAGQVIGLACDVSNPASVEKLHAQVLERFGKIDILVNSAAIVPYVEWDALTFEEWQRVMRVNLDGIYLMCRAASDVMRKAKYGRIVSLCSSSIFVGSPSMAHYIASKGGVLTFSRALATELGDYGITVNTVSPGLTDTEGVRMTEHKDAFDFVQSLQAIKRRAVPDDIVPAIAFLVSDEAHWITGQTLNVDGGFIRN